MSDLFNTKNSSSSCMSSDKAPTNFSQGRQVFEKFISKNFTDKALSEIFENLTDLYFEVNNVINISAIRSIDDIYIKHYLDSIYPYEYFTGECCDVGCGGGFPCIPLAIVTKHNFTGIDSVGKKLTLINRFTEKYGIKNIRAIHSRAEDVAKRGVSFDTVCSRAVANVDKSLEFCTPLAKQDGKIILYRTQNDSPAVQKTVEKYSIELERSIDYCIPDTDIKRRLFVYIKKK